MGKSLGVESAGVGQGVGQPSRVTCSLDILVATNGSAAVRTASQLAHDSTLLAADARWNVVMIHGEECPTMVARAHAFSG